MPKFKTVKEIFSVIKLEPFMEGYTSIKPRGGFYHRVNGKSTSGKPTTLTEDDKVQMGTAIDILIADLQEAKELLKPSVE